MAPQVQADRIMSINGEINYYDVSQHYIGIMPSDKIPVLPAKILINDEVTQRIKVELTDGSFVWMDTLNLEFEDQPEVAIACKSSNTGKSISTVAALTRGLTKCKEQN
jgi:hypothetical protein